MRRASVGSTAAGGITAQFPTFDLQSLIIISITGTISNVIREADVSVTATFPLDGIHSGVPSVALVPQLTDGEIPRCFVALHNIRPGCICNQHDLSPCGTVAFTWKFFPSAWL